MTKMNPVNSGVRHPIDGDTERRGMNALVVATLAIAMFVIGGVTFYSFSDRQPKDATSSSRVADAFLALEASPPASTLTTTTGQGSR
jgi:hypothetical protein